MYMDEYGKERPSNPETTEHIVLGKVEAISVGEE
jgi:hypothetical protein